MGLLAVCWALGLRKPQESPGSRLGVFPSNLSGWVSLEDICLSVCSREGRRHLRVGETG